MAACERIVKELLNNAKPILFTVRVAEQVFRQEQSVREYSSLYL